MIALQCIVCVYVFCVGRGTC